MIDKATYLERHKMGRFGSVIDFVKDSEKHGEWICTDVNLIDYLKRAAKCNDDVGRELACDLIAKIESLMRYGDELRDRFSLTSEALRKVNETLKEEKGT